MSFDVVIRGGTIVANRPRPSPMNGWPSTTPAGTSTCARCPGPCVEGMGVHNVGAECVTARVSLDRDRMPDR